MCWCTNIQTWIGSLSYLLSIAALLVSFRNLNFLSLSLRLSSTSQTTKELDCRVKWKTHYWRLKNTNSSEGTRSIQVWRSPPTSHGTINIHNITLTYWRQETLLLQHAKMFVSCVREWGGWSTCVTMLNKKKNEHVYVQINEFIESSEVNQKSNLLGDVKVSGSPTILPVFKMKLSFWKCLRKSDSYRLTAEKCLPVIGGDSRHQNKH